MTLNYWGNRLGFVFSCFLIMSIIQNSEAANGLQITLYVDSEPNALLASESTTALCMGVFMWTCVNT